MPSLPHFPTLEVNLAAIQRNWRLLSRKMGKARSGAVVKANAYGLGVEKVAPALFDAGCRDFFVATLEEGIQLRKVLADQEFMPIPLPAEEINEIRIYVFHGVRKGEGKEFARNRLIPVINEALQLAHWRKTTPWALHVDTGMNRLGVSVEEVASGEWRLAEKPCLVMSHLACANTPKHPKNKAQLAAFKAAVKLFPGVNASLANSSGIFLGKDYHFDVARPGCSLYGVSPDTAKENPMEGVAILSAPVLQYRTLGKGETVGYGATGKAKPGSTLATMEIGYADGFLRRLSNKGCGYVGNVRVPIVGRVSMDMVSVDVSKVPEKLRTEDLRVIFVGKQQPVDTLAEMAGTIGYEVFSRLGRRVKRVCR